MAVEEFMDSGFIERKEDTGETVVVGRLIGLAGRK